LGILVKKYVTFVAGTRYYYVVNDRLDHLSKMISCPGNDGHIVTAQEWIPGIYNYLNEVLKYRRICSGNSGNRRI
jgi:hypothetical protein